MKSVFHNGCCLWTLTNHYLQCSSIYPLWAITSEHLEKALLAPEGSWFLNFIADTSAGYCNSQDDIMCIFTSDNYLQNDPVRIQENPKGRCPAIEEPLTCPMGHVSYLPSVLTLQSPSVSSAFNISGVLDTCVPPPLAMVKSSNPRITRRLSSDLGSEDGTMACGMGHRHPTR